jgi:hypothetical protein
MLPSPLPPCPFPSPSLPPCWPPQDSWVLKALGKEPMLVAAADHIDIDWEAMWRERLSEQARLTALGWSAKMKLEALVVNIRWVPGAAAGGTSVWGGGGQTAST